MRVYTKFSIRDRARTGLGCDPFRLLAAMLSGRGWLPNSPAITWTVSGTPPWTEEAHK